MILKQSLKLIFLLEMKCGFICQLIDLHMIGDAYHIIQSLKNNTPILVFLLIGSFKLGWSKNQTLKILLMMKMFIFLFLILI